MKKYVKMLALLLAVAVMVATLAACGNEAPDTSSPPQASETPGSSPDAGEPTVINFWHHYSAQSAENETLMNVLIPKFEEEHPEYKVNAVSHEWADLHDKILISANSNTLPDVARLDIAWVPEFEAMDILVPLDQEIADFSDVAAALLPSAMSTGQVNGSYYALALNTNTKILFYNAEAFENAGLAAPETIDDMLAAIAALSGTNENGQQVWGLNEPALAGWNILPYIWSMGGEITNEDYTQATGFLNSAETVAAVQMLADLYKNGQLTGFNSGDIPMTDGFGTGRYMMLLEGPWKTAEMAGAYPDFKYADLRARRRGHSHVQHREQGGRLGVHEVHDERVRPGGDGQGRPDPGEHHGARERHGQECGLRALPRGHHHCEGPPARSRLVRHRQRADHRRHRHHR